jgi:cytochrome bd-type quinol oxidase subunit 1
MPFQFGANWSRFSDATALWLLTALLPLQTFLGDQHGLNTLTCQPAKLAAIEARWTPPAARH